MAYPDCAHDWLTDKPPCKGNSNAECKNVANQLVHFSPSKRVYAYHLGARRGRLDGRNAFTIILSSLCIRHGDRGDVYTATADSPAGIFFPLRFFLTAFLIRFASASACSRLYSRSIRVTITFVSVTLSAHNPGVDSCAHCSVIPFSRPTSASVNRKFFQIVLSFSIGNSPFPKQNRVYTTL